jgi:hypothetical protein
LDSGRALGIACQRAGLEEYGMIQGEDICSKFIIGCDVQGGLMSRGNGPGSQPFVVEEGSGIQVSFPGQGCPVDWCVVMEILGVLEELGEYLNSFTRGHSGPKKIVRRMPVWSTHLNKDTLSVGTFRSGLVSLARSAQSPGQ